MVAAEFLLNLRPNVPVQPINVTLFATKTMPKRPNVLVCLGWKVLHNNPGAVVSFDIGEAIHYWRYTHQGTGELLVKVRRLDTKGGNMSVNYIHAQANFLNGPRKGPYLAVYLAGDSQEVDEPADSTLLESLKTQPVQLPGKG